MKTPDLEAAQKAFAAFCETIAALRDPQTGCPWDLEQDHESLRRYMLEEAYEATAAMSGTDDREICDELGDVLLQVVLNAQLALDRDAFTIVDVVNAINAKMLRRHPHVFGTESERADRSIAAIKSKWQEIKETEKDSEDESYFAPVKDTIPALTQSLAIGKRAAKIAFDWDDKAEVLGQVLSEVEELKAECKAGDDAKVREELGDVFFSLAQLARHYGLDPETVAFDANRKFLSRFEVLEEVAAEKGIDVANASRDQLESLWQEAKQKSR